MNEDVMDTHVHIHTTDHCSAIKESETMPSAAKGRDLQTASLREVN